MPSRPAPVRRPHGFTLVELLLAVSLLAGLIGAVAFGFSNLQRNAQLDEGVERIETALRFARAHAANTGHKVQVVLAPTPPSGMASGSTPAPASVAGVEPATSTPLRIEWEADPVRAPGVFEPLATLSADVTDVSDLVEVRSVERESSGTAANPVAVSTAAAGVAASPNASTLAAIPMVDESADASMSAEDPMKPAAITFYPDGSCDGATIVLASRDSDDGREVAVRVQGVTGTTRREWRDPSNPASADTDIPAASGARANTSNPASTPAPNTAPSAPARRP